jgi:hypothetical protein
MIMTSAGTDAVCERSVSKPAGPVIRELKTDVD